MSDRMNGIVPIPAQRAMEIDERLREIDKIFRTAFAEIGLLVMESQQKELWRYLCDSSGQKYHSLEHWICNALPVCRSSAMLAKSLMIECQTLPREKLLQIPRSNIGLLAMLPAKEQAEWVDRAINMPYKQLVSALDGAKPELLLEHRRKMTFNLLRSQYFAIENKIQQVMDDYEVNSREAALEILAAEYEVKNV